jgi:2-polyprenyl-3-methyl-5-hydroxy-6-metoxy-1,4-benzoquinol methylase
MQDIELRALSNLSDTKNYNDWISQLIDPFLGNRILEVGAGIGNMTEILLKNGRTIFASDVSTKHLEILQERFQNRSDIFIQDWNMENGVIDSFKDENLDTVVCINVLEHIKDDSRALKNAFSLLAPNGRLLLFIPAHPLLFGKIDKNLGHYRRYAKSAIVELTKEAGFKIQKAQFFNRVGFWGWFLNSRLFNCSELSEKQMRIFNSLVPLWKLIDHLSLPFGQSLFIVARKEPVKNQ